MSSLDIKELLKDSLAEVENILANTITDSVLEAQVNFMCQSIIKSGGKRFRPILALLCAKCTSEYTPQDELTACRTAAIVELLHTATLIHDDVIDNSPIRRGQATLNDTSGNHAAVLAGDYLFTRCFKVLYQIGSLDLLGEATNTIGALVAGEINQLKNEGDLSLSIDDYQFTIYAKTGALFELSTSSFAVIKKSDPQIIDDLRAFGKNLGIAFQIVDDILDYKESSQTLGKKAGLDLEDHRITLPIIFALENSNEQQKDILKASIDNNDFDKVKEIILSTGALELSYKHAKKAADEALACLDKIKPSVYKDALFTIVESTLNRNN